MTDAEIQEQIKARLKEEGIEPEQERPEPTVRPGKPRPPAPLPSVNQAAPQEVKPRSQEVGSPETLIDDVMDALERQEQEAKASEKKKKEQQNLSDKEIAAGAGALTGVAARLSGRDISSGFRKSPEGSNIFSPKVAPQSYQAMEEMNRNIAESQKAMAKLDEEIRNITRNPKASAMDFTPDQVQRILSGGEGPTMNTTGAQRGYGYNAEQQRRARTQAEIEANIRRTNPAISDPIVKAGQVVPLRSGIQVPTNVASEIAQEQARAQSDQQRKSLMQQQESEQNKIKINQQNMNQEANLAKSRGFRSGLGKTVMGGVGGAQAGLSGYDIYQKFKKNEPITWEDWSRLGGSLAQTFGGPRMGVAGALATLPYAIKNREELLRGMTQSDINPTAFPAGTTEGDELVISRFAK
jgi:hypothetical protein